ncbi:MAG: hypothetical protein E4G90_11840 [Gemmatimonadales bacterium]|nr:MAG: hypothetical protein E4G90_11840 [Gemmatimonadales bacterium]
MEQILKRTRAEANRALAGDSKDKNLSECRQLPTDGRNYSMEAELRRAAVEDTDEARALPIPPEAWDAHQADESSLGPQEEDAAFESDPRYLTIRAEASPQEWKVFRFFWDNPGAKPKEIARAFDLSTSTVRVHWKHLRDKFPK